MLDNQLKNKGFTTIEVLIVLVLMTIISVLASPSILGLLYRQKLAQVGTAIYTNLSEAQSKANSEKISYSVALRNSPAGLPQLAIYKTDKKPANWQNLTDTNNLMKLNETTIVFQAGGLPQPDNVGKKITVQLNNDSSQRCVQITTLIGDMYQGKNAECN